MKINKIREMSSPDLEKELGELKSELFKLRFSLATNGLDNPMKIKEVKKDIAKIKTVLTQRELNGEKVEVAKTEKVEAKKVASKAKKEETAAKKTTKKVAKKESK
jgi:large subunit ribosomal protein L29